MTVVGLCPTTVLIGTSAVVGAGLLDYVRRRAALGALSTSLGGNISLRTRFRTIPWEMVQDVCLWDSDDGEDLWDEDV